MNCLIAKIARLNQVGVYLAHISIFIIFIWIGGLKFFNYEAQGIVPFVANNPIMKLFIPHPKEYIENKIPEGKVDEMKQAWHQENNTYIISKALGITIMLYGILVLLGLFYPILGVIGGILVFFMTLITLSFLFTTPEVFVPNLGDPNHGFPYLAGAGRLVLKDLSIMACGLIVAASCAKRILDNKGY